MMFSAVRLLMLAVTLPLVGCEGCSKTGDTGCDPTVDVDADGWAACDDCDDQDPTVHPWATDCVNGTDDDCDGEVDGEGAPDPGTWHDDNDGDGFGDYVGGTQACDQPEGTVGDGTDCDDQDPAVNPAADESCNGVDDDCDGLVDEEGVVDAGTWYTDTDGDGYGDPDSATVTCDQLSGAVSQGGDCDDDDPEAHPHAEPGCDGRDLDCDGLMDNDTDVDGHPDEGCGGDDCDDGDAAVYPSAPEVCGDGVVNDCDGSVDEAIAVCWGEISLADSLAKLHGEADSEHGGWSVAGGGDVDGDGLADLLVGAPGVASDTIEENMGAAYLFLGPISGTHPLSDATAILRGEAAGDRTGIAVAFAGDVNADGFADLLVGGNDTSGADAGAAYLVLGPVTGELGLELADAKLVGELDGDDAGEALSGAGDVNGDGYHDLLIGAYNAGEPVPTGGAYLVRGPLSGESSLADADTRLLGESMSDSAGSALAGLGDVDGDGLDDLLVGARFHDDGVAYLLLDPPTGNLSLGSADAILLGVNNSERAGWAVAGPGDLDGDGLADLLVGAPEGGGAGDPGVACAMLALPIGSVSLSSAEIQLVGAASGTSAGSAVAGAGDADGDGTLDLLIGAYQAVTSTGGTGTSYLVLSPEPGTLDLADADSKLLAEPGTDFAGYSLASAGDTDGDGLDELLIGAYAESSGGSRAGAAYLVSLGTGY